MTTKLADPNSDRPKYAGLRRFLKYAVMTFLIYVTAMGIINAPNILASAVTFAVLWAAGILIYRSRRGWGGWLHSDKPLATYVKEHKARVPASESKAVNSAAETTTVKVWDYSAADNEHLQPLSNSERQTFQSLTENFD